MSLWTKIRDTAVGFITGRWVGELFGAAIDLLMGRWLDSFQVPEPGRPRATGSWADDTWAPSDRPVPVVYGAPRVEGVVVYSGGEATVTGSDGAVDLVDPSAVLDVCVVWGEGPVAGICGLTVDDVPVDELEGASVTHYLGTADQEHDARFVTVRQRVELGTPDWYQYDAGAPAAMPAAKTVTFTPAEDGATAWVHLRWQAAITGEDREKSAVVQLEYRPNGGAWTDGGLHLLRLPRGQTGPLDAFLPVGDPTGTDTVTIGVTVTREQVAEWGPIDGDPETGGWTYTTTTVRTPTVGARATDVGLRPFAGGVAHEVRLTAVRIGAATGPENSDFVLASLVVPAVELEERLGAQPMRFTAYSAITVPRKALQNQTPRYRAHVLGRPVTVYDAALVTRWTNNPVWLARDMIADSRYGLALPGVPYDGASDTEWGGARRAALVCDAVVSTLDTCAVTADSRRWEWHGRPWWSSVLAAVSYRLWPAGSTALTLYRAGANQGVTATFEGHADGRLTLSGVSDPAFAFAAGDYWQPAADPSIRYILGHADPLVSYAVTGLTDTGADYSGYLADRAGAEARLIGYHDRRRNRLVFPRDFATAPSALTVQEQRFRFDGALTRQGEGLDVVREVLTHARALLWEDAGRLRIAVETAADPVGEIDGQAEQYAEATPPAVPTLSGVVEGSFECWEEREDDLPDALVCRYVDPDAGHQNREVTVGEVLTGGYTETREWMGCLNVRQVQRLGWHAMRLARLSHRARLRTPLGSLAVEPGDVLTIYHPVGGALYGYDVSDPDAPVRVAGTGMPMRVISLADDPSTDERTLLLREYAADAYSDEPGLNLPERLRDTRRFGMPPAVTHLTLTWLGDLTEDGVWNPEVRAEWVQPQPGTVAYWEVFESRDEGDTWHAVGVAHYPLLTWKLFGYTGSLYVRVIPVSITGIRGAWSVASIVGLDTTGDTTAPATPTGLVASFTTRVTWTWNRNTELDLSHYEVSLDEGETWERTPSNAAEVLNPNVRAYTLWVRAVDRSGNASDYAAATATLEEPVGVPGTDLVLSGGIGVARAAVLGARLRSPGHVGYLFRWRVEAGETYYQPTEEPEEAVNWSVALGLFAGASLTILVSACEVDVVGAGEWGTEASVSIINPAGETVVDLMPLDIRNWVSSLEFSATDHDTVAWSSGTIAFANGDTYNITGSNTGNLASDAVRYIYFDRDVSQTTLQITTTATASVGGRRILVAVCQRSTSPKAAVFQSFGGLGMGPLITADNIAAGTITADELAANLIYTGTLVIDGAGQAKSDTFAEPGDDNTTPGSGWRLLDGAAEFYAGSGGLGATFGGVLISSNGDYLVGVGVALTATGKGKRYPRFTGTNFGVDGQTHNYAWDSTAAAWVEISTTGIKAIDDDYAISQLGAVWAVASTSPLYEKSALLAYSTNAKTAVFTRLGNNGNVLTLVPDMRATWPSGALEVSGQAFPRQIGYRGGNVVPVLNNGFGVVVYNATGSTIPMGTVCGISASADYAVTPVTNSSVRRPVVITIDDIPTSSYGPATIGGHAYVRVSGDIDRGNYVNASSTAGVAVDGGTTLSDAAGGTIGTAVTGDFTYQSVSYCVIIVRPWI